MVVVAAVVLLERPEDFRGFDKVEWVGEYSSVGARGRGLCMEPEEDGLLRAGSTKGGGGASGEESGSEVCLEDDFWREWWWRCFRCSSLLDGRATEGNGRRCVGNEVGFRWLIEKGRLRVLSMTAMGVFLYMKFGMSPLGTTKLLTHNKPG